MVRSKTRDEILAAAARLFASTGFKGTSLHDIAVEVGCSKAALLYHFDSKNAILTEMMAPAIRELSELGERLAGRTGDDARRAALEGFVDLVLRYRQEISVLYGDLPELLREPAFAHILGCTERLLEAFAGGSDRPGDRLSAKVLLAGVPAAAFNCFDLLDPDLRAGLLEVGARLMHPLETKD